MVLDVFCVAGFFVLRLLAGAPGVAVVPSVWLPALRRASRALPWFAKRRHELISERRSSSAARRSRGLQSGISGSDVGRTALCDDRRLHHVLSPGKLAEIGSYRLTYSAASCCMACSASVPGLRGKEAIERRPVYRPCAPGVGCPLVSLLFLGDLFPALNPPWPAASRAGWRGSGGGSSRSVTVYLARTLGAAGYGVIAVAMAIMLYLIPDRLRVKCWGTRGRRAPGQIGSWSASWRSASPSVRCWRLCVWCWGSPCSRSPTARCSRLQPPAHRSGGNTVGARGLERWFRRPGARSGETTMLLLVLL